MISYIQEIYMVNGKTGDRKRSLMLNKTSQYMEMVFKTAAVLYTLSVLSYFVFPVYIYLADREIITILPIHLPGIDYKTLNGYLLTTAWHAFGATAALFGTIAAELMFTMLIMNAPTMAQLIRAQVMQVNRLLNEDKHDVHLLLHNFRNLLMMHREMTR